MAVRRKKDVPFHTTGSVPAAGIEDNLRFVYYEKQLVLVIEMIQSERTDIFNILKPCLVTMVIILLVLRKFQVDVRNNVCFAHHMRVYDAYSMQRLTRAG